MKPARPGGLDGKLWSVSWLKETAEGGFALRSLLSLLHTVPLNSLEMMAAKAKVLLCSSGPLLQPHILENVLLSWRGLGTHVMSWLVYDQSGAWTA